MDPKELLISSVYLISNKCSKIPHTNKQIKH